MKWRRIDPAKAAAAAGGDPGWYAAIPVPKHEHYRCGICDAESATVPATGGLCLKCRLQERTAAREASA
jgi:hypothetical protein